MRLPLCKNTKIYLPGAKWLQFIIERLCIFVGDTVFFQELKKLTNLYF